MGQTTIAAVGWKTHSPPFSLELGKTLSTAAPATGMWEMILSQVLYTQAVSSELLLRNEFAFETNQPACLVVFAIGGWCGLQEFGTQSTTAHSGRRKALPPRLVISGLADSPPELS